MKKERNLKRRWEDFFRRYFSINQNNWSRYTKFIPMSSEGMKYFAHPFWGRILRRMGGFEGENRYTQSYVVPINRQVGYKTGGKGVVVPIEKIRQVIEESSYRVIMNRCVCRDGFGCTNYPRDHACIMLGEGTRNLVARGIARYAPVDDALAHLERAGELGLVAICAWVEFESVMMGIPEEQHEKFFEICLCCPCCCIGMRNFKYIFNDENLRGRFNTTGWRALGTEECVGCGACVDICPMDAITVGKDGITVNGACIGCGLCTTRCPKDAIVMQEIVPMKDHILDYFWGFTPQVNG